MSYLFLRKASTASITQNPFFPGFNYASYRKLQAVHELNIERRYSTYSRPLQSSQCVRSGTGCTPVATNVVSKKPYLANTTRPIAFTSGKGFRKMMIYVKGFGIAMKMRAARIMRRWRRSVGDAGGRIRCI
jgi:hypothetical protein